MDDARRNPTNVESNPVFTPASEPPRTKSNKRLLLIAGAILIVLIAASASYLVFIRHHTTPVTPASHHSQNAASLAPQADTQQDQTPLSYASKGQDLNLSFTYPASWQVSPPSGGNTNDQTITVTSPRTTMANVAGESVIAHAVLTIRPKGSDLTELDPGTATAALDSIQIAYTKPTSVQHGWPYITFMYLRGGNNPGAVFDEVMITGALKFTKNQVISPYTFVQLDPIVSVRFYQCQTQACSGDSAVPFSVTNDTWQSSVLGQQALAIFESLQIH